MISLQTQKNLRSVFADKFLLYCLSQSGEMKTRGSLMQTLSRTVFECQDSDRTAEAQFISCACIHTSHNCLRRKEQDEEFTTGTQMQTVELVLATWDLSHLTYIFIKTKSHSVGSLKFVFQRRLDSVWFVVLV